MVNKTLHNIQPLRKIFAAVFFLALAPLLQTQESGFILDTGAEGPRFIQHLAWAGDENTLRYDVIVEREERGTYQRIVREFTGESYIEVSLSPGNYRYRVIPYDFLDHPGEGSSWINFTIRAAISPEIVSVSTNTIYLNSGPMQTFSVSARNMESGAVISLYRSASESVAAVQTQINGITARVSFNTADLTAGIYDVQIKNPSGLLARGARITVIPPDPVKTAEASEQDDKTDDRELDGQTRVTEKSGSDINNEQRNAGKASDNFLSLSWIPFFPIYGEDMHTAIAGLAGRLGAIAPGLGSLRAGMEFALSWYNFGAEEQPLDLEINLLVQKRLPIQSMSIMFRAGMGYVFLFGGKMDGVFDVGNLHTDLSLSFMWQFSKRFLLETGLSYVHFFTEEPSGSFRPWIGAGLRF